MDRGRCVFDLAVAFCCFSIPVTGFAQSYAPQPARLAVKAAKTTVPVGSKGQILVTFLDRKYQATSNDVPRVIELSQDAKMSSGSVEMPHSVEALPGQKEVQIEFTARKPGRVLIRAASKGLEPGSALLTATPSKAAHGSWPPSVWAQESPKVEIIPDGVASQVPANGTSSIGFFVTLDASSPSETQVRVDCAPQCVLLYDGANTRLAAGSLVITLPPAEQTSSAIRACAYQPGSVTISARAMPQGQASTVPLTFVEPQPASLVFEEQPLSIPLATQSVPLMLHLADQDNIALSRFTGSWHVSVGPAGDAAAVQVQPAQFILSGQTPARGVLLTVNGLPIADELHVFARDDDGSLRAADKKLGFESIVGRLAVLAPAEVNRHTPTNVEVQFLLKDQDREAATEFPRTVTFFTDRGKFDPESVTVQKGENRASSVFTGDDYGMVSEFRVSTWGVDVVKKQLLVVMALSALAAIALGSGAIGGLIRFFYYREGSWDLWPTRKAKGWNPGMIGNAAFCGVFGVVLLLMCRTGLHQILDSQHLTGDLVHTPSGGFLLGIAGGFVGVGVLELLARTLGLADVLARREKTKVKGAPAG